MLFLCAYEQIFCGHTFYTRNNVPKSILYTIQELRSCICAPSANHLCIGTLFLDFQILYILLASRPLVEELSFNEFLGMRNVRPSPNQFL